MRESEKISVLTEVMREADIAFETTGGGTRHYVRDLLLPILEKKGFTITPLLTPSSTINY